MKLNLFFGLMFLLLSASIVYLFNTTNGTKYINTTEVFASFDLKIELESELLKQEKQYEEDLNRIKLKIADIEQKIKQKETKELFAEYNFLFSNFQTKEKDYSSQINNLSEKYNKEVWQKLEISIKEFAIRKKVKVLVGNTGDKSVIYADEQSNLTKECIEFVNNKYAGKQ